MNIINAIKNFGITILSLQVGAEDFSRWYGIRLTALDFYVAISKNTITGWRVEAGHHWYSGWYWSKSMQKAG